MNKLWRLWAKALGQKATDNDSEADKVAWIRTLILVAYLVTNRFIVAGVVRHWDDNTRNLNNDHLLGNQL